MKRHIIAPNLTFPSFAVEHTFYRAMLVLFRCVWLACLEFVKCSVSKSQRKVSGGDPRRSLSDSALHEPTCRHDRLSKHDVAHHNRRHDCWMIIKGKVYDVTSFLPIHPGGEVLLTQAGRDATEIFTSFHAATTWTTLKKYYIADLAPEPMQLSDETATLLTDFRALRTKLMQKGMFRADPLFYAWKTCLNFAIFVSMAALLFASDGWGALLMAAFLLALFWQQMGWLAHDFCHHQVFQNRRWNNLCGYLFGNICQGFSVNWWKSKHNTHHAATNEISGDHAAVDPDIDTLPLLAWSAEMLGTLSSPTERTLIRYQHHFFIPILLLARFSWAQQSFSHALHRYRVGHGVTEFLLICLHYGIHIGMALLALPWTKAMLFLLLSQALSGFMLGLAFVQSHNGMEIYGEAKDFVTAQVISTRDIVHSAFVDFFMGGLNYQIEHHLFPTMPRHNLRKAQVAVKALCAKHGLPYEECTMDVGTQRVVQRLIDVAKLA